MKYKRGKGLLIPYLSKVKYDIATSLGGAYTLTIMIKYVTLDVRMEGYIRLYNEI